MFVLTLTTRTLRQNHSTDCTALATTPCLLIEALTRARISLFASGYKLDCMPEDSHLSSFVHYTISPNTKLLQLTILR